MSTVHVVWVEHYHWGKKPLTSAEVIRHRGFLQAKPIGSVRTVFKTVFNNWGKEIYSFSLDLNLKLCKPANATVFLPHRNSNTTEERIGRQS